METALTQQTLGETEMIRGAFINSSSQASASHHSVARSLCCLNTNNHQRDESRTCREEVLRTGSWNADHGWVSAEVTSQRLGFGSFLTLYFTFEMCKYCPFAVRLPCGAGDAESLVSVLDWIL